MASDKKLWSGAVIVVTAVIAGAGTLPALLLRPSPDTIEPMSAETARELAVSRTAPTKPEPVVRTVAVVSAPALAMIEKAAEPTPVAKPVALPTPVREVASVAEQPRTEPAAAKPIVVAAVPEAAVEPSATQKDIVLPPVPLLEAASAAERTGKKPAQAQTQAPATATREVKRKPPAARPAPYPIGEFLAWRR